MTISGKPLKDHEKVVGHARAIDRLYDFLQDGRKFSEADLFALHKALQAEVVVDVYKPVGGWRKNRIPQPEKLQPFTESCKQAWQESITLVDEAWTKQQAKNEHGPRRDE